MKCTCENNGDYCPRCLAVKYLTKRYEDQCFKFPLTRDSVTLEGYIKANLPFTLKRY